MDTGQLPNVSQCQYYCALPGGSITLCAQNLELVFLQAEHQFESWTRQNLRAQAFFQAKQFFGHVKGAHVGSYEAAYQR